MAGVSNTVGTQDIGVVPDEVLLLLGRDGSSPSAWWTPSLVDASPTQRDELVADARRLLLETGVLGEDGQLSGPLADAADIVRSATTVLTIAAHVPGDEEVRCSLVTAGDRVLLDVQDHAVGGHALVVMPVPNAVVWLADLLDPSRLARGDGAVPDEPVALAPAEVRDALPELVPSSPTQVVRMARVGTGGATPVQHTVTLHGSHDGLTLVWALPDGGALVVACRDVVELAAALVAGPAGTGDGA